MQYTHELYNKHTYYTRLAVCIKEGDEIVTFQDEDDRLLDFPKSDDGMYESEEWAVRKLRTYQYF